jgi:hypothetical protein
MGKIIENPGSDKAIKLGCTCPVLDNNHGEGLGDGLFYYSQTCNYHQQYPILPATKPKDSK